MRVFTASSGIGARGVQHDDREMSAVTRTIEVNAVGSDDVDEIAAMIREMDEFYGDPVPYALEDAIALARDYFLESSKCAALIARMHSNAVGMATYVTPWPTVELKPCMFVKDVFVRETARGRGVARALLTALAARAIEGGFSRIDWTADRDNRAARALYESLKVPIVADKLFYRLEGGELTRIARLDAER